MFTITKETYSNKEFFTLRQGNSIILSFTKKGWNDWVENMYSILLTYSNNKRVKNGAMYKESLNLYNFICNYFKIKTI